MVECIFCKIATRAIQTNIIYEDNDVMAFLDVRPANPGHALVIPKMHIMFLPQLPADLNAKILQLIKIIAQSQIEVLGAEGVNVLQNNGAAAGQAVPHVHFHVIPRFKNDKVTIAWEPCELKEEQIKEILKRLKEHAQAIATSIVAAEEQKLQAAPEEPKAPESKKKQKPIKLKPRHA
ncbi:MAG: HIT family protein [Candidatus Nanoarchaeia archaeon]